MTDQNLPEKGPDIELYEDVYVSKRDGKDEVVSGDGGGDIAQVISTQAGSAMAAALLIERPKFVSRRTARLFACLFVAYLCSAQNGFDANTFGGVSDMPNFKAQFGTDIASTTGFLAAIYVIGAYFIHFESY